MCKEAPAGRLEFLLGGDGTAVAIQDGQLEIRLLALQRNDFTDVVHGVSSSLVGVGSVSMVPVS